MDTAKNSASAADYVLTNGEIYTVNEKQPWAEAIAVKRNKIVLVGSTVFLERESSSTIQAPGVELYDLSETELKRDARRATVEVLVAREKIDDLEVGREEDATTESACLLVRMGVGDHFPVRDLLLVPSLDFDIVRIDISLACGVVIAKHFGTGSRPTIRDPRASIASRTC